MLSIYTDVSSRLLAVQKRGLKIVPTIKLFHIQCSADKLRSLVRIKLQHPLPDSYYQAGHV